MINKDSLYRTFYGETPPPWATDCPIRFEVWLKFAKHVRTVGIKEAAASLRITQAALRSRLPGDFPSARKVGQAWRIPIVALRLDDGDLPQDTPTKADLEDHPRVDVILSVNGEFGPKWVLSQIKGQGSLLPLAPSANPIAAGSYVVALVTFAELIRTIIPLTNLGRKIRSAQSLGPVDLRLALAGQDFDLPRQSDTLTTTPASVEQRQWEDKQLELRHNERVAHLKWFLRVLTAVAGSDSESIEALAELVLKTNPSPTTDMTEVVTTKVIDRRRRYPIQSVNLNRQAKPSVTRSRTTIKADAADQLFAVDASSLVWAVVDSGIDAAHDAFVLRDEVGAP
jgi:hypothetical protein